jgi:hypothetical protein
MKIFDYVVVGSGCSGAMAAQTLIEEGKSVHMVDVGVENTEHPQLIPEKDYLTIRKTEPNQHQYLIGSNAEGLTWGDIGKGAQVTPPRRHLTELVERYLPLKSETFSPIESLGYGGLGIGWGLQCWEFSESDMQTAGLDPAAMYDAYETVSKRIGISATKDSASGYTMGKLKTFQPSANMDRNHTLIYDNYKHREKKLNANGFYMGRTPLALLTEDKDDRKKYAYRDMDFYSDNDKSAWRPWITVNELKKHARFSYQGGLLVTSFDENNDHTVITCLRVSDNTTTKIACRKLVLAANPMSSGRIVLRSLGSENQRLPILCNPYTYIPCLQPRLLGREAEAKKMGFAQLTLFYDPKHDNTGISVASLYSYQSLMLFRVIRQAPLNFVDGRILMRYLMPGLEIMGVHHPDMQSADKYMQLVADDKSPTRDALAINYTLSEQQHTEQDIREKAFIKTMRGMGVYALKRINPGYGSSVHYAGTLPFSATDKPFTLGNDGRLHGTRSVYVADSSGFTYLPAKGLTFSLLANAHIIAKKAAQN